MLDFVSIELIEKKNQTVLRPSFHVGKSKDLMIRGHDFYAIWDESCQEWSTDEYRVAEMIDRELNDYLQSQDRPSGMQVEWMKDFDSGRWTSWRRYLRDAPDNYHELNLSVKFLNDEIHKEDYVTKRLDYPLEVANISSYEELMNVLYIPEERKKLEWMIGAVIAGASKDIQKFFVLYGAPKTGKSTFLKILRMLFGGYLATFDAKALGSRSAAFPLEVLKDNPLLAIQDDGDLSRIEDNTTLNSIVSHEWMSVNEKYKTPYPMKFKTMLILGTNKPVKITDAKSGLMRRLIDVHPTGNKVSFERYEELMSQIKFERPGIAWHCLHLFQEMGANYYDDYRPRGMIGATNDIYNFILSNYDLFRDSSDEGIPLKVLWKRYKEYVEDALVQYPLSMRPFTEEMRSYFEEFKDRSNGQYSVFFHFKEEMFDYGYTPLVDVSIENDWLDLKDDISSELDSVLMECPAQYANDEETPTCKWEKCKAMLRDLDTSRVHYVRPPENHIVIDFDLKNEKGEKCYERNVAAARKFPRTYVEVSKGGAGLHLHYIYTGDVSRLAHVVDRDIEIKVFTGKSSLRRKLTKCNDLGIAEISSGLPLRKERKSVLKGESVKSERKLRELVDRGLRKEIWPNTAPSMDFIKQVLDDAYNSGLEYDLRDLRPSVQVFAMGSSHQADRCMRMIGQMKWCSEEQTPNTPFQDICKDVSREADEIPIVFYDVEVFPNLFVICWKIQGPGKPIITMINPKPAEVEELFQFRLVGFNNRKYDNHILYAASMGYTTEQLFKLSQRIIDGDRDAFFSKAYNLSYTDIYDFLSAQNKMSLKKWEIKLGIHHQELGLPWDQPVPEEKWPQVGEYCCYDVTATEAVWDSPEGQSDWLARQILAEWSGLTENDTTNNHTTQLIVGNDKNPQSKFIYTDLSTIFPGYEYDPYGIDQSRYKEGAKIVRGKSIYRGLDPGEGGFAWAKPGMYQNIALLDVESMHPHSLIRLNLFGDEYTMRFADILGARLLIKHKDYDGARALLPERLHKYLDNKANTKKLSTALKTAINSVYGLTSASFPNRLRDPRNVDNIVAKYGALFMITLKEEVENRGYTVVHIKTDSIKIANADNEIIKFCEEFAKEYGFTFAHEATYRKMCIVNDAVYIAQYDSAERCQERYGYIPEDCEEHGLEWTATGTQFQVPYVFKTLFSHEPIEFKNMCETKSVKTALYLDFNEKLDEGWHDYRFVGRVGLFVPVIEGVGGAILCRDAGNDKMAAVTGTKKPDGKSAYRWMEAETFKTLDLDESKIDRSYYDKLVEDAIEEISKYGDFERFVSEDESDDLSWLNVDEGVDEELPFPMNEPLAA